MIMLDLETLATDSNAVICQIGCCSFKLDGTICETFLRNVDVNKVQQYGFNFGGNAIQWWLQQSKEAQASLFTPAPIKIADALNDLNEFMKQNVKEIWRHSNFDFVIIQNAYRKMKIPAKFHFKNSCDIRTLDKIVKMCGYGKGEFVRGGVHHNALDDCKFQVAYVSEMLRYLKGLKDNKQNDPI